MATKYAYAERNIVYFHSVDCLLIFSYVQQN